jgi:hypothetical protein
MLSLIAYAHLLLMFFTLCHFQLFASAQSLPLLVTDSAARPSDPGEDTSKTPSSSSSSSRGSSKSQQASSTKAAQPKATDSKDTSKIKLTLAKMPYEQLMCEDTSEVSNGATLNVSWTR